VSWRWIYPLVLDFGKNPNTSLVYQLWVDPQEDLGLKLAVKLEAMTCVEKDVTMPVSLRVQGGGRSRYICDNVDYRTNPLDFIEWEEHFEIALEGDWGVSSVSLLVIAYEG
jgi:hypothetical protein